MLKGTPVSTGQALAKALILTEAPPEITTTNIPSETTESEIKRFNEAIHSSQAQLETLYETSKKTLGEEAEIIKAQISMLSDPVIKEEIETCIRESLMNAGHSTTFVLDSQIEILSAIEDEYIRERAIDLSDIKNRLLHNLADTPAGSLLELADLIMEKEYILICENLTPSQTANLNPRHVKGIICKSGGKTSHAAIMARSLGIPAIMGCKDIPFADGDIVFIDGSKGHAYTVTDENEIKRLQDEINQIMKLKAELMALKDAEIGKPTSLYENVGSINEYQDLADGIGLFRTEFLYMDRKTPPSEDTQFEIYKKTLERLNGKKVVFRTFDIGGDKEVSYLKIPKEDNPFLGWRAVRICLDMPELFQSQLRALLRASAFGKLSIMIPMISSVQEIRAVRGVFEEVKAELRQKDIPFDHKTELGIMIEIPSAAICADSLIKESDFFSIGTNDLIQYTVAVDRGNDKVSKYYDFYNPAVLRLVKMTIDASHSVGKTTSMCGEAAGDPVASLLLLGLGLDGFSVSASILPKIKKVIMDADMEYAKNIAEEAMKMDSGEEVRGFLEGKLADMGLDYLVWL